MCQVQAVAVVRVSYVLMYWVAACVSIAPGVAGSGEEYDGSGGKTCGVGEVCGGGAAALSV